MENNNQEKFDNSPKNFIKIMWSNTFIQIFIVALSLFVAQLLHLDWCAQKWMESVNDGVFPLIFVSMGLLLPLAASLIVFFKTVQFWSDLKSGRSR